MRRAVKARGHPRREAAARGRRRRGGDDGADKWGPGGSDRGKGVAAGLCKLEEEAASGNYAKAVQAGMGRAGPKVKKNSFLNRKLIFDYSKALEICRRTFRRNFDMRIFPKFF
jgi:hypothetical protein